MRSRRSQRYQSAAKALVISLALANPVAAAGGGLVLTPDWTATAILMLGFIVLIFPLNALIFRPLFQVLDRRDERIAGSRRRASQLQVDAQEILDRYESSVRDVRDESEQHRRAHIDEARAQRADVTKAARDEAASEAERARGELQTALDVARGTLRASNDELAREIAGRVLGRPLS